jgi:hypothetical protein
MGRFCQPLPAAAMAGPHFRQMVRARDGPESKCFDLYCSLLENYQQLDPAHGFGI